MSQQNLLPLLYDSEVTAGWHAGMAANTRALLRRIELPRAPDVLEVGCGSGDVLRLLGTELPDARCVGMDLNPIAVHSASESLRRNRNSGTQLAQANLLRQPFPNRSFDLLLALDSFDQIDVALGSALAEAWRLLRPGGYLFMRVSAYPWLYGPHDRAFRTGRRYTRGEVRSALKAQGFALEELTHANSLLAPPVVLLRLLNRVTGSGSTSPAGAETGSTVYASPMANRVVEYALRAEARWLDFASLPAGLSLITISRKVGS